MNLKNIFDTSRSQKAKNLIVGNRVSDSSINRINGWVNSHSIAILTGFRNMFQFETSKTKEVLENMVVETPEEYFEAKDLMLFSKEWRNCNKGYVFDGYVYSNREKFDRNYELRNKLIVLGYGVTSIKGAYRENASIQSNESSENSLFVVNLKDDENFFTNIFKLSEYYNQDSFLYKDKNDDAKLVGTNNSEFPGFGNEIYQGQFRPKVVNEYMSRKKNSSFVFGNDSYRPDDTQNNFINRKYLRSINDNDLYSMDSYVKEHGIAGGVAMKQMVYDSLKKILLD